MGANGAGKTTLLRCIASTVRPTCGEILCFGADVRDPSQRRLLGIVGHESRLYPSLTLRENLRFAARMHSVQDADRRAGDWLRDFGLEHHGDRMPRQVSRGMRQRASLARACIHEPRILLLDEPFAGLDAEGRESLLELFHDLKRRGRTLCFATHDRSAAAALADRILVMEAGRVHQEQSPATDPAARAISSKAA
jgi:ABC-type multidrug transport system ATPase subunit